MADDYWIIEFRLPSDPITSDSPDEAARIFRARFEKETGLNLSNWFCRAFKYSGVEDEIGYQEEWFCNPSGTRFRKVDQNIEDHERKVNDEQEHD